MMRTTADVRDDVSTTGVINCAAYAGGQRVADLPICDISEALEHKDWFVLIGAGTNPAKRCFERFRANLASTIWPSKMH